LKLDKCNTKAGVALGLATALAAVLFLSAASLRWVVSRIFRTFLSAVCLAD
jgi:fucose permease